MIREYNGAIILSKKYIPATLTFNGLKDLIVL